MHSLPIPPLQYNYFELCAAQIEVLELHGDFDFSKIDSAERTVRFCAFTIGYMCKIEYHVECDI